MTGYFSRLFDPPQPSGFFGPETDPEGATSGGMVVPVVANFGLQGPSPSDHTDPKDWPWRLYPDVDPRMPFFGLPPNAVFNMPVYKRLPPPPVPPWIDEHGYLHLDNVNPKYKRMVTPGEDT